VITGIHLPIAGIQLTVKWTKKDGTHADVNCLPCLPDHQHFMRGVDCGDEKIGYYSISVRSRNGKKRVLHMWS